MAATLSQTLRDRSIKLSELARQLSVNKSTATRWMQRRIPAERVIEVERITGVPRHELRPDIYPSPEIAA